jgi:hypothetical protein
MGILYEQQLMTAVKTNYRMNCDGMNMDMKPTQLNQSNPLYQKIELPYATKQLLL